MRWIFSLYVTLTLTYEELQYVRDDAAQAALDEYITQEIESEEIIIYNYGDDESECVLEVTQDTEICHED